MTTKKTDLELMDYILSLIYSNGSYSYLPMYHVEEELKGEFHPFDLKRIWQKTIDLNLTTRIKLGDDENLMLSHNGMEIMRKYKSYLNYTLEKEGEIRLQKKREKNDRRLKNVNSIITLVSITLACAVTLLSLFDRQEAKLSQQRIEELKHQLDSLHELESEQKESKSLNLKDSLYK